MALDMTSFSAALKQHYMDLTVKNLVYKNNPFYALCPKYEKFGGLNMPIPLIYGNPQGRSATFSNALAQKTNSQIKAFTLTRVKDYSLANIDNETIEASQGDADAFMRAATTEIDGAFQAISRSIAIAMYGDGRGFIGRRASISTNTVTLSKAEDITNFEVGQTVQAHDGSSTLRTGSTTVASLDRGAGTVTLTSAAAISGFTNNDYLLVAGDLDSKIKGLGAWVPTTAPGATAFFGVDRTADVTRLGGVRKDVSALPIEEGLVDVAMLIGREGGSPDKGFMSFQNFANLEKALGSKVIYQPSQSQDGVISFEGIKVHGQKGPISIIPDQNCPSDVFYLLQMDSWKLCSLGMAPKLLKSDGMDFLRVSSEDSVEVRVGAYLQLACHAPGWNGVGKLA